MSPSIQYFLNIRRFSKSDKLVTLFGGLEEGSTLNVQLIKGDATDFHPATLAKLLCWLDARFVQGLPDMNGKKKAFSIQNHTMTRTSGGLAAP